MLKHFIMTAVLVAALLLPVAVGTAQDPNTKRFAAFKATLLAATAEVITIQQPASDGKVVRIEAVEVWCDVACTATIERDGTAATTTALANSVITYGTAAANAFSASNVGVGTVITVKDIPANVITPVSFPGGLYLAPTGTASNFTVRTSSITGNTKITLVWREGR